MAINQVKYGNTMLIDLTDTTATAADVATGKYFYTNAGVRTAGTNSGGGGKNIQVYNGYDEVRTTSYSATDVSITVSKSGVYDISWIGWRSTSSGTSGSQLYINGTAVGTAVTSFVRTYGQHPTITNRNLNAGDVLVVRARARGTSYYMCVGNLIIEEQ